MYPALPAFSAPKPTIFAPDGARAAMPVLPRGVRPDEGEELTGDDAAHVGLPGGDRVPRLRRRRPRWTWRSRCSSTRSSPPPAMRGRSGAARRQEPTLDHQVTVEARWVRHGLPTASPSGARCDRPRIDAALAADRTS